ncbi:BBE domain-containing protein [Streptomyces sp. NPDC046805]|uniref:BBE domain-containing protein n=1 Tax=Streptomyces sp. NPDC046805 TaxID=3155134 RepID=UPI0033D5B2DF
MVDRVTEDVENAVLTAAASGIMMQIRSLGGAMADIPADRTAFANRTQPELIIGTVFHRTDTGHLDRAWAQLAPSLSGAYANFETRPTPATTRLAFPEDTTRRLHEIKERYDPQSVFRPWPL